MVWLTTVHMFVALDELQILYKIMSSIDSSVLILFLVFQNKLESESHP